MSLRALGVAFLLTFVFPIVVQAYVVNETVVSKPYEIVPIAYPLNDTAVLVGELEGYPIMYEFTVSETAEFSFTLLQRYRTEPLPLSGIAVRTTQRGVAEVGRLTDGGEGGWKVADYPSLGVEVLESDTFIAEIMPGRYRIEVSTPDNDAQYVLLVGGEAARMGYFETLRATRIVQRGLGYPFTYLLTSPYVYYPLGIILLLIGIERTWRYRKYITNAP